MLIVREPDADSNGVDEEAGAKLIQKRNAQNEVDAAVALKTGIPFTLLLDQLCLQMCQILSHRVHDPKKPVNNPTLKALPAGITSAVEILKVFC